MHVCSMFVHKLENVDQTLGICTLVYNFAPAIFRKIDLENRLNNITLNKFNNINKWIGKILLRKEKKNIGEKSHSGVLS